MKEKAAYYFDRGFEGFDIGDIVRVEKSIWIDLTDREFEIAGFLHLDDIGYRAAIDMLPKYRDHSQLPGCSATLSDPTNPKLKPVVRKYRGIWMDIKNLILIQKSNLTLQLEQHPDYQGLFE